ncbi:2'-5' RNA ligase family protein [Xylophilus sp. GOD-11R]|uniref:2'-5' RNA ligase family protein n=1 Tax=Xylophilus sp. GOD-11R TaxID=3089814 RepID=UPI00298CE41E|nr:2'-5' RNA ligase family protein [Xylophilus sp. GOD-11R]WPB55386.1 2'-5' RNA ligase family protein [Xylophilus sp. GOD-11R]
MSSTALIVTLQMDEASAARFTELRRQHFPPERNWLEAHITLFHALPVASLHTVLQDAAAVAGRTDAFRLRVDRVHFLGAGVAYAMSSPEALAVRATLAEAWLPLLGRQDLAWRGPLHVTVQNKVQPPVARRLQAELEQGFQPHDVGAVGLQVWHYEGGPWRAAAAFSFAGRDTVIDRRA